MGKNIRHIPDGQDFGASDFASQKGFGFSGSSAGGDTGDMGASAPMSRGMDKFVSGDMGGKPPMGGAAGQGHPMGHQVTHVEHNAATGEVTHHHAHGGYTVHGKDGSVSHHGPDGQQMMGHGSHNPGEGTYLSKQRGGDLAQDKAMVAKGVHQHEDNLHGGQHTDLHLARGGRTRMGGHHMKKPPIGGKMPGAKGEPMNRPPRNPTKSVSTPNAMPGGQMAYGVQPSAEPDVAGSEQGIPQLTGRGAKAPDNL